jgi:hypothetical protein
MTDRVDIAGGAAGPGSEPARARQPRQSGLPAATLTAVGILVYLAQRCHMSHPTPVPPYR